MSLGELVVELGVVGDTSKLEEAAKKVEDFVKNVDKQINATKRLRTYLKDLSKAQSEHEKKLIKEQFAQEISKDKALKKLEELKKQKDEYAKLGDKVAGFAKGVAAMVIGVTAATAALSRMTNTLIQQNQAWINLTRQTDIGLQTFQKYANVANAMDSSFSAESAAGELSSLNQRLFNLRLTGEGARGFQLAGINPYGQNADGILEQLRERIKSLDNTQATYLLQQLGINPQMLGMLRLTRGEFEELNAEYEKFTLNIDQRQEIEKYQREIKLVSMQMQYMKDRALLAILPYFVKFQQSLARIALMFAKLTKNITKFLVKWRGIIVGAGLILSKFKPVVSLFTRFGAIVTTLSKGMGGIITKIPIIGRLLGGLGAMISKYFWWLTAIYILIDDIAGFINGDDSLIGRIVDWVKEQIKDFKLLGEAPQNPQDWVIKIIDIIDDLVQAIFKILAIITGLPIDKWGVKLANMLSNGAYDKLKNYEYGTSVNNNTTTTSNNTNFSQTNNIYTSTPAQESERQYLTFANNYVGA